jgi:hypothetical protein
VPRPTRQAAYSTAVAWDRSIAVAGHQQLMAYAAAAGRDLWTTPGGEVAWRASRGGAYVASPVFDGAGCSRWIGTASCRASRQVTAD